MLLRLELIFEYNLNNAIGPHGRGLMDENVLTFQLVTGEVLFVLKDIFQHLTAPDEMEKLLTTISEVVAFASAAIGSVFSCFQFFLNRLFHI